MTERTGSDAPLDWGSSRELNAFEVLMWRAEADRTLSSTICLVEELDEVPEWGRFVAAHGWARHMVPRFGQRAVEPPLGLGAPRWTVDPEFDLGYHLRRLAVPDTGGWAELLEAATALAMTPFDRRRPLWEAVLFEGLPGGWAVYVLKTHHIMTDGMTAMQLFGQLHSRQREHNPEAAAPVGRRDPGRPARRSGRAGALGPRRPARAGERRRLDGVRGGPPPGRRGALRPVAATGAGAPGRLRLATAGGPGPDLAAGRAGRLRGGVEGRPAAR